METSSSHDLSVGSVEVFEDSFASTLSSQFLHSTPIKGTIHGKQEIVAVAKHLKYSMKAPPLVSNKESKGALKKNSVRTLMSFFLACSESSLYIPRHSNQFKQRVC